MSYRTITVPANSEVKEKLDGRVLVITSATNPFSFIPNQLEAVPLDQGRKYNTPAGVRLRTGTFIETAGEDNTISFYAAEEDLLLTQATAPRVLTQTRATVGNAWAGTVTNAAPATFNGLVNPDGFPVGGSGGRKEFIISCTGGDIYLRTTGDVIWARVQANQIPQHFEVMEAIKLTVVNLGDSVSVWTMEVNWSKA